MVGVRETVRPCARLGDDGALLEREDGLGRTHEREERLDRLPALRVGDCVRIALGDRELDTFGARETREERRRLRRRRPQLDVRRAAERQRAGAEERAAQIRGTAAAAPDDTPRRPLERPVAPIDDAGCREHAQGLRVAGDVELVARRRVERPATVRPDLGADPAVAQQRERTTGRRAAPEVEVERPVACPAEVEASGGVEQRGELGATIALALRRDRSRAPRARPRR